MDRDEKEREEMEDGEMTVREAGKKGGETTSEKYGHEFYEEIGEKGGERTSETHGHDFYEEIGKKGGEKGGQRVRELIEEGKEAEQEKEEK
ncbi:MAG: hypothetical protein WCT32_01390 [Patescibacteria group bacterium]|jgi:hypothetical protein